MLQSVTQQLSDAHLSMDLNQSKDNVAYSMPQPSSASLLPLIPTPSSVSIATTIFPNSNSNQFTPGMCLPGSTAAGYTAPMDEHHQSSNSLSNGILPSNNDTAIVQAQQQQQQPAPLLNNQFHRLPLALTHLNLNQVNNSVMGNNSTQAAANHSDSLDDSSMS